MKRALLTLLLLAGCTSAPPPPIDSRAAVLFVPGFYGSTFREKSTGRRIFYSVREALFGSKSLALFAEELGMPKAANVEVDGLLDAVIVIPWLYEVPVYGPFLKRIRDTRPDLQVIPVPFDWRDDLTIAVAKLDAMVKELERRRVPSITIFAHSTGGMVAAAYLAHGTGGFASVRPTWEGAKHVNKVAFFGTPFRGSMISFRSFLKGSGLPRSQTQLAADAMSTFPSLFELNPAEAVFLDREGQEQKLNLSDPAVWEKHGFGLLRAPTPARLAFTRDWALKSGRWSALLNPEGARPASLRVLNVVGTGHPTLDRGYLNGRELLFDPEDVKAAGLAHDPLFRDGDGTVTHERARLPDAWRADAREALVKAPHDKLFLDPVAEQEYKDFLR